ncbi:pyridoxal phosphate-dependent aminotransferase [Verticiella sediminum]|uniref:Aminotransferase n=1 Tax=Verticiella sediminum TaxID=1247510 RepID=A0A556AJ70_9BURK|nr:pyridoxal phosphate-dependent aminotransferase [Verticiella sediminum]TSH92937.1 pyridoxal phosphate-dependent aminotransferase [Verticiella sediminum]
MNLQSRLLAAVSSSQSIATAQRARDLIAQGHDIVSVTIGEPDFPTPPAVIEAAFAAARQGATRYTPVPGTAALRCAIAGKFVSENGMAYDPDGEVFVATGAKQVIYDALTATLNPDDEVVVFAPYWVSYPTIARLCGATPVIVATRAENGFVPTAEELASALTPRTRWVMLNYPNNPTGAVATRAQYEALAQVLEARPDVFVLSDEIYEHIRYDDRPFTSFGSVSEAMRTRTLVVNGVSKAYGMTGWRIGYAGGPRPLIAAMAKLQSHVTGGASAIGQAAALAALGSDPGLLRERAAEYRARRDLVLNRLANCPALEALEPKGAFYVFVRMLDAARTGGKAVDEFLLDHGVAVIAGDGFGAPGWFRISIATSIEELERACARIVAAFGA